MERPPGCGAQASTEGELGSNRTDYPREEGVYVGDYNSNNRSNKDGVAANERQKSRRATSGGELCGNFQEHIPTWRESSMDKVPSLR
jgi:hypothetical protein